MNTEPEFLSQQCPPCSGDCRQGRNCPAYANPEPLPKPVSDVVFWVGTIICMCVMAALVVVVFRGCSA